MPLFGRSKETAPIAVARGTNGSLELYEHMVRIQRKKENKDILDVQAEPGEGLRAVQSRIGPPRAGRSHRRPIAPMGMRMGRIILCTGTIPLLVLATIALVSGGFVASAQDGAEPTISALQTQVARLEDENLRLATPGSPTPARTPVVMDSEAIELTPGLALLSYRFLRSGIYQADSDDKATFVLGELRNTTDQMLDAPSLKYILLGW